MRVSELLGLKWGRVDLELGCIQVEERYYRGDTDEPKTEKSKRELPLGKLAEVYARLRPIEATADSYVFHENGEPLDDRAILRNSEQRWSFEVECAGTVREGNG